MQSKRTFPGLHRLHLQGLCCSLPGCCLERILLASCWRQPLGMVHVIEVYSTTHQRAHGLNQRWWSTLIVRSDLNVILKLRPYKDTHCGHQEQQNSEICRSSAPRLLMTIPFSAGIKQRNSAWSHPMVLAASLLLALPVCMSFIKPSFLLCAAGWWGDTHPSDPAKETLRGWL